MRARTKKTWKPLFALMGVRLSLAVVAMSACILTATAADTLDDGKTVLVHTDAGDVTVADVRANLAVLPPVAQVRTLHDPDGLSNMARLIAAQRLILKEAKGKGWDRRPDVAAAIDAASNNIILEKYISNDAQPAADYPAEPDLRKAYDTNKTAFTAPRKFHYAVIVVALAKGADQAEQDKARAKLSDIQGKLQASNADFGTIASTSSDDASTAKRHGDVGTIGEDRLSTDIRDALLMLKAGAVSAPVRVDQGWCILKLIDVTPAGVMSFDEVREQLRTQLRAARTQQTAKTYVDTFVQKIPVPSQDALTRITGQPHP
ncbi:MAG TPA: peptidyl-prolyl cis-trans isomerase [Rhizomicrobium sp.]